MQTRGLDSAFIAESRAPMAALQHAADLEVLEVSPGAALGTW